MNVIWEQERPLASLARVFLLAAITIVPLAVGFVPFRGQTAVFMEVPITPAKSAALGVLVGLAALLWAFALVRGEVAWRRVPLWPGLLAFGALLIASTIGALDTTVALFGLEQNEQGLLAWAGCLLAFLLVVQLVDDSARLRALAAGTAVAGSAVALLALLQSAGLPFYPYPLPAYMAERGTATIGNPDMLGTFLVLPAALCAGLALSATTRARIGWAALGAVSVTALLLTQTRGAWLGLAAAAVVLTFLLLRSRRPGVSLRRLVARLAVGAASVLGAAAGLEWLLHRDSLFGRWAGLFSGSMSDGGRLVVWAETLRVIRERPLLGAGPDNLVYAWYRTTAGQLVHIAGIDGILEDAHSIWLNVAATLGVPAALVLFAVVIAALVRGWRSATHAESAASDRERTLFAAVLAGTAGLTVALAFSVVLTPILLVFWVGIAMLLRPDAAPTRSPSPAVRLTASVVVVVLGLSVSAWGTLTGASALTEHVRSGLSADKSRAAQAASELAPWRQSPYMSRAKVLAYSGAAGGEVSALLEEMVAEFPREYRFHKMLIAFYAKQPERAVGAADAALAVYPNGAFAMARKATALAELGRLDEASPLAADAWSLAKSAPKGHRETKIGSAYAEILLQQGRRAEARVIIDTLGEWFPDDESVAELESRAAGE